VHPLATPMLTGMSVRITQYTGTVHISSTPSLTVVFDELSPLCEQTEPRRPCLSVAASPVWSSLPILLRVTVGYSLSNCRLSLFLVVVILYTVIPDVMFAKYTQK